MNKQVICDIDGQFFSMDSMCVRSIENGKAEMVLGGAPDFVEGIRKFRGEWVPIVRLRTLLGIDRSEEPVLRRGICTGELVAGFCSLRNGRFREIMLITSEDDLKRFCHRYAVDRTAMKEITAG